MTIWQRMSSLVDFQSRRYVAFVLSHPDAEELRDMPRYAPPDEGKWEFHGVPILAANIHTSYVIEESWEHPLIHML